MTRWLLHDVSSENGGSNGDTQYHPTPEEIERGCERWLAENPGGRASNCPCEEALRLGKKVIGCIAGDSGHTETDREKREIRMGALICVFVLIAFAVLLRLALTPKARRARREREEREARERAEAAAAKEKEIRRSWRTGMFAVQPDGTQIVVMVMHPEDESFGDFGAGLVDERGLNSQCVSRTGSPNPTHRRQYSTGHGYEFDASREVVVNADTDADTDAEEASAETPLERPVTAAPPPTPAPEEEAEEITADVVVAVNLDGTR
mmetsp:Transcript_6376/g.28786  ORF Transcript_6376/g.28786 Transcript_6376/m.28786 type:complete len:265 (+) Transcript_6376:210-1004(+)